MKKLIAVLLSLTLVCGMALPAFADGAAKDETVYILAAPDGAARKIIVSDWLSNPEGAKTLADVTTLTDVENVKGDETFDGSVWQADGHDIYYQGVSDAPLPLTLTITYTLDGEIITPDALASKSGHVTIRFDFAVSRTFGDVSVPYAVLTGALLDNDVFTNVSAVHAHVVNDGDRTLVAGIALPGLRESLALDAETIDLPESITIEADAKAFALPMTLTLATSEPFARLDADKLDDADDLKASVTELTDGMAQLLHGSSQLIDGLTSLSDGASALSDGVTALSDGLNTLIANNATLTDGATQVFEALLSTADQQLSAAGLDAPALTIDTYADTLDALLSAMNEEAVAPQARIRVEQAVRAQEDAVQSAVTQAVQAEVSTQVSAAVQESVRAQVISATQANVRTQVLATMGVDDASALSDEQRAQVDAAVQQQLSAEDVQSLITANIDAQMTSDDVQSLIAANTEAQMASDDVQSLIAANTETQILALIEQNMASDDVRQQIADQVQSARDSLSALKAQLDSYSTFHAGLTAYTDGAATAAAGAAQLKESMPALTDGITALKEGASALKDGLNTFHDEGVAKLDTLVNEDLDALLDRVRALIDAARNDCSHSGIPDGMDGAVRYIWRTDSVN